MHACEHAEEISVERSGVWNARISKQRGEHRSERDPENHGGGETRCAGAIKLFHESADDEGRVLRLLPRQHAKDAGLHGEIQNRDADYGNENAAWDVARGIADFAAQMADIVIAPVGVNRVYGCRPEGRKEQPRKIPRAGCVGEDETRLEMRGATPNKP